MLLSLDSMSIHPAFYFQKKGKIGFIGMKITLPIQEYNLSTDEHLIRIWKYISIPYEAKIV